MILAHDRIDQGDADKGVCQGIEHRQRIAAGGKVQGDREHGMKGPGQGQQPQVAFLVYVANGAAVGCLPHKFHACLADKRPCLINPQA